MILALLLLIGQLPPQAPPLPKVPQAPPIVAAPQNLTYAEARRRAIESNRPLVVYVDTPLLIDGDWLECRVTAEQWGNLGWDARPMVVVGVPRDGHLVGMEVASPNGIFEAIEVLRR